MPNQRKQGKKHAGSWIPENIYQALKKQAEQSDVSISDLVSRFVEEGLGFKRNSARKADTHGKE